MTDARRSTEISAFLAEHKLDEITLVPLADDASFRRYFRVRGSGRRSVLMDAPPGREDVRPFLAIADCLRGFGYSTPEILAVDPARGFVLLEDLGDDKLSTLAATGQVRRTHYELAIDLLVDLHARPVQPIAPPYDETLLMAELGLFVDWYVPAAAGSALSPDAASAFNDLWQRTLSAYAGSREVLVLLDYHADNLMWLEDRRGLAKLGLLDFQDAVIGHPAYDLVSLLEDARLDVDVDLAEAMLSRYIAATDRDSGAFRTAFAILGAQRNSKIIGIFTRLLARDGKPGYLELIPRVWRYLERDLSHPELDELRQWYDRYVPVRLRETALAPEFARRVHESTTRDRSV
jgi:aminoglycoside/choline kinase family phosphotransferase